MYIIVYNNVMKILLKDLINIADEKTYEFNIDSYVVENNIFLRRIEEVEGYISFYYDASDELRVNYHIGGNMICPDAVTLEDVYIPFDIEDDQNVVNDENKDGFFLNRDMTMEEMALYLIVPEVPIKVVKNEKIEYSRGDGWSFVSEEDYESSRADEIDPRLQKLKEYKFEEDE